MWFMKLHGQFKNTLPCQILDDAVENVLQERCMKLSDEYNGVRSVTIGEGIQEFIKMSSDSHPKHSKAAAKIYAILEKEYVPDLTKKAIVNVLETHNISSS